MGGNDPDRQVREHIHRREHGHQPRPRRQPAGEHAIGGSVAAPATAAAAVTAAGSSTGAFSSARRTAVRKNAAMISSSTHRSISTSLPLYGSLASRNTRRADGGATWGGGDESSARGASDAKTTVITSQRRSSRHHRERRYSSEDGQSLHNGKSEDAGTLDAGASPATLVAGPGSEAKGGIQTGQPAPSPPRKRDRRRSDGRPSRMAVASGRISTSSSPSPLRQLPSVGSYSSESASPEAPASDLRGDTAVRPSATGTLSSSRAQEDKGLESRPSRHDTLFGFSATGQKDRDVEERADSTSGEVNARS